MESDGLVIMTNDGKLGHRLAHPRYQVKRVYTVAVGGAAGEDTIERLKADVDLEDGPAKAHEARVISEYEGGTVLEIVMTEGRKREIRRMLAACGFEVVSLTRTSFGGVGLGELSQGEWRHLSRDEVRTLRRNTEGAN
jgi:23S rRNA pseudouridine2605 synthase